MDLTIPTNKERGMDLTIPTNKERGMDLTIPTNKERGMDLTIPTNKERGMDLTIPTINGSIRGRHHHNRRHYRTAPLPTAHIGDAGAAFISAYEENRGQA